MNKRLISCTTTGGVRITASANVSLDPLSRRAEDQACENRRAGTRKSPERQAKALNRSHPARFTPTYMLCYRCNGSAPPASVKDEETGGAKRTGDQGKIAENHFDSRTGDAA